MYTLLFFSSPPLLFFLPFTYCCCCPYGAFASRTSRDHYRSSIFFLFLFFNFVVFSADVDVKPLTKGERNSAFFSFFFFFIMWLRTFTKSKEKEREREKGVYKKVSANYTMKAAMTDSSRSTTTIIITASSN